MWELCYMGGRWVLRWRSGITKDTPKCPNCGVYLEVLKEGVYRKQSHENTFKCPQCYYMLNIYKPEEK